MHKLPQGVTITRIINYLRRSREDVEREARTGEDTITMQKSVMDRVLADYGLPYDQVIEIGSGDKIETRPVFQQVIRDLESGRYNCIAVKEISRLTRGDFKDYGIVYELIRQKRIYIITPYRIYDPKNAHDMRQIRFEMFLSREEFEIIRERMQGAKYSYAMSGKFMGSTPAYGYLVHPKTQHLEPDTEKAPIVRMIFDLYLHGIPDKEMSDKAIATYLTRAGIPSPSGLPAWNASTIKNILHNPVYIGEIRYSTSTEINKRRKPKPRDEWIVIPDAHEPLISLEIFEAAMQKRASSRPAPSTRFDCETSELSSLIRCTACGHKMIRQATTTHYRKKDGSVSRYEKEILWCTTVGCTYVKYRAVEAMILHLLQEYPPPDPELLHSMLDEHQQQAESESSKDTPSNQLTTLHARQAELTEQLRFIYKSYESQIYSEQEFITRRQELQDELTRLEQLILRTEPVPVTASCSSNERTRFDPQEIRKLCTSWPSLYRALPSPADKNKLLRQLIESIQLTRLQKGRGNQPSRFTLSVTARMTLLEASS
ncbi:recombinase family protein [Brevibacillus dissolubilis]|uniref:recombinase family protein n=1 Tax=Brevibacillus dissolubilis TaxID=1844116 RepID=UPI001115FCA5|nr:recombinase family protein [Brevibacillus dissolubilis]